MSPHIQELLNGKTDKIDYNSLIKKHPWIIEEKRKCILSPDSDGFLCGLCMSHYLNWEIIGYYDGKIMLLKDGETCDDAVFLDMEIARPSIKSFGHHMLLYNNTHKPRGWDSTFKNCIQPNNIRNYDCSHTFRLKYPYGTIHMLLGILGSQFKISLPDSAIAPLLFVDGTFNVLYRYPENCLNWHNYLNFADKNNPVRVLFESNLTMYQTLKLMDAFFRERDTLNVPGERGDKFKISNSDGRPHNIYETGNKKYAIFDSTREKKEQFIDMLCALVGWKYISTSWCWEDFNLYKFTKSNFLAGGCRSVTIENFDSFFMKNPLSWAVTANNQLEYTLETPDKLPITRAE